MLVNCAGQLPSRVPGKAVHRAVLTLLQNLKKRAEGSPCLPGMLLATLPCRSLLWSGLVSKHQIQEAKLFSCSVSPAPSTDKV